MRDTALHIAAYRGYVELAATLLGYNALVNAKNQLGKTPLYNAILQGHYKLVRIFLAQGGHCEKDFFYMAGYMGHMDVLKILLEPGPKKDQKNADGRTLLHGAAISGTKEIVQFVDDSDIDARDHAFKTPMHYAAENGHAAMVQALLERNANIDALDEQGRTPLLLRGKVRSRRNNTSLACAWGQPEHKR